MHPYLIKVLITLKKSSDPKLLNNGVCWLSLLVQFNIISVGDCGVDSGRNSQLYVNEKQKIMLLQKKEYWLQPTVLYL